MVQIVASIFIFLPFYLLHTIVIFHASVADCHSRKSLEGRFLSIAAIAMLRYYRTLLNLAGGIESDPGSAPREPRKMTGARGAEVMPCWVRQAEFLSERVLHSIKIGEIAVGKISSGP